MAIDTSPERWMSLVSDDKKLCEITIPGTHNTCAHKVNFIAKCQSKSVREQLKSGIRFLDIRCRHINDRFDLHHGISYLGSNFETMKNDCYEFLKENPTETIVMMISPEFKPKGNKCSFEEVFIKYANQNPGLWFMKEHLPCLKEVRGKIVLLRRFYSQYLPLGIDMSGWRNNKTFGVKNHSDFGFEIQDEYKKQTNEKWDLIVQHVNKALVNNKNETWYLNYCSAVKLPMVPMVIAKEINKKLLSHFGSMAINKELAFNKIGTIILDFSDDQITRQIYQLNFEVEVF